jgi:hypothetical protein
VSDWRLHHSWSASGRAAKTSAATSTTPRPPATRHEEKDDVNNLLCDHHRWNSTHETKACHYLNKKKK